MRAADAVAFLPRAYHAILSPILPPSCRFHPSCSEYAALAIERHGVVRGALLSVKRLSACHPWHPGGIDLVPPRDEPRSDRPSG